MQNTLKNSSFIAFLTQGQNIVSRIIITLLLHTSCFALGGSIL